MARSHSSAECSTTVHESTGHLMVRTVSQLHPSGDWPRSAHRTPISGAIYTRFPHMFLRNDEIFRPVIISCTPLRWFGISSRVTHIILVLIHYRDSRRVASTHQRADMWRWGNVQTQYCLRILSTALRPIGVFHSCPTAQQISTDWLIYFPNTMDLSRVLSRPIIRVDSAISLVTKKALVLPQAM